MIMESVVGRRYCESDIMTLTASVRRAASRRGRHVGTVRERRRRRRRRGRGARGSAARHAAGHAARARYDTGGVRSALGTLLAMFLSAHAGITPVSSTNTCLVLSVAN